MKKPLLLAAALAVLATPAVHAQTGGTGNAAAKPAATAAPEDAAKVGRASLILQKFNAIFQSKSVQQPVKNRLMTCLYNNNMKTIVTATDAEIAKDASLKKDNADDLGRIAAKVCGVNFSPAPTAGAAAPKPAANGETR